MAQSKQPRPVETPTTPSGRPAPRRKVMTVVMDDGTVHTANVGRPGLRRVFAAAHDGREPSNEFDAYWCFWHAIGRPGNTGDDALDVATFMDQVEAEEIYEEDVDLTARPTSQA